MSVMRRAVAALAAGVLIVTGCAQRAPGTEAVQQVRIDLVDYKFRPQEVRTRAGRLVEVSLRNRSGQPHEMVIETPEGEYELEVAPGAQVEFGLKFRVPGTYRILCDLEGHADRGMVGSFVVEGEPNAIRWLGGAKPAPAEQAQALRIDLADYRFVPGRVTAAPGTLLEVTLTNSSAQPHELVLSGGSVEFEAEVAPGGRFAFGLRYSQPGTYEFVCELPGHSEQGMRGQIIVH